MFGFRRSARTTGAGRWGRVVLTLEGLETRAQPSTLTDPEPPVGWYAMSPGAPANAAPVIENFQAEEISNGMFMFTGKVIDESPGGLVVRFGGSVMSVNGLTATTQADGRFTLIVQLKLDGTDVGLVTAQTTDAQGLDSNVADVYVHPTP